MLVLTYPELSRSDIQAHRHVDAGLVIGGFSNVIVDVASRGFI